MSTRLIVVSNRLPLALRKSEDGVWVTEKSSGGLASAMNPLLRNTGGIWIGWSGDTADEHDEQRRAVLRDWARNEHCFAIELPAEVATGFYEGLPTRRCGPSFITSHPNCGSTLRNGTPTSRQIVFFAKRSWISTGPAT